ncbi:hypothetical protein [Candidatus Kuenenia stuttgartiensis]|uniref:hypothetical protein n=1 Tax=Kuenenia stuttgartiensis TaxID=174633 RepID=UPI001E5BE87D|nr:hypothetical protein [Candidatus Kuenenia stuttgartiensis]
MPKVFNMFHNAFNGVFKIRRNALQFFRTYPQNNLRRICRGTGDSRIVSPKAKELAVISRTSAKFMAGAPTNPAMKVF